MNMLRPHESFNSSGMFFTYCSMNFNVLHSLSSSYVKSVIAACILIVIFGIVGTFLNTLVLFVFSKSKKMRQKNSYFSIMILSATDLVVTTSVPVVSVVHGIDQILGTPRCLYSIWFNVVTKTTPLLSATSLIIMNIERYLAIVYPFFHRTTVTKRKMIWSFCILGCIFQICAAVGFIGGKTIVNLINSVGAFIIVTTTVFQYVSIFFIARKSLIPRVKEVSNEEKFINLRPFLRDLKMARTYFFIVFLCFICYLPIAIILGTTQHFFANEETRNALLHWNLLIPPLILMNATLNCLIFFWGNRELRIQSWKLVRNCFRKTAH